jgi:DNA polymerase I
MLRYGVGASPTVPVKMNKILLVDGHNLLFKAFFGIPEKLLPNGKPVHGVIGFIAILIKIIKLIKPTHVLVVFDPEEKPTRTALYPQYKANRQEDFSKKDDRENPFTQLAAIVTTLDNLNIRYIIPPGYEADDMIASYAAQVPCEVVIASSDTDFLQLLNQRITIFRYHGKKSIQFDEAVVKEKYSIHPSQFLEYKALIGDKTDNIDGIRGIGSKNAIKIIQGVKQLSEVERGLFEKNRKLIKLDTNAKLPFALDQLLFTKDLVKFKTFEFLRSINIL